MQHRREVEVDYYVVVCIIIYIANQQRILPKLVGYNGSLFYEEFIKTIGHWRILKCEAIGQTIYQRSYWEPTFCTIKSYCSTVLASTLAKVQLYLHLAT